MNRSSHPTPIHRFQYALFLCLERAVSLLPRRAAGGLGRTLGWLFYRFDARHRRVVRENLRSAGLGLDEAAVTALSLACFEHFGSLLCTTLRLLRSSPESIRRITRIEGREHILAAFAEGRGVIGLTGHLGNWELLALAMALEGWNLAVVGRELDNPLLEARLRTFRSRFGNAVIPKDGAVRGTLKVLKRKGGFVGFLLDQDAGCAGVFVPFLGRWASTFPTAGLLAVRLEVPILPVASRVQADGTVTVRAYPPFHAPRTGNAARDAWAATQRMSEWLEARVREDPGQWFWMHRRFKTQPGPGTPELPPAQWLEPSEPELAVPGPGPVH